MASRYRIERALASERGGPSSGHSQNQKNLYTIAQHQEHFEVPRKVFWANERRKRLAREIEEHYRGKLKRIESRAEMALSGKYGGYDQGVLLAELRFLKENGINVTRATASHGARLALVYL